jgi:hypothetical protein
LEEDLRAWREENLEMPGAAATVFEGFKLDG